MQKERGGERTQTEGAGLADRVDVHIVSTADEIILHIRNL